MQIRRPKIGDEPPAGDCPPVLVTGGVADWFGPAVSPPTCSVPVGSALWSVAVTDRDIESIGSSLNEAWPVAVLLTEPALMSAWVIWWMAVQVFAAPGASVSVSGQVTVPWSSVTVTGPESVTLPVLVKTIV